MLPPDQNTRNYINGANGGLAVNLIVKAVAGTGKTRHLIQRLETLLYHQGIENVRSIVATTFTEKAAAEMAERLRHALEQKAYTDPVKAIPLLMNFEFLHISTIHSFCFALIQDYHFELGLPPVLSLWDEDERAEFVSDALIELFQSGDCSWREEISRLLRSNGDLEGLMELFEYKIWKHWDLFENKWINHQPEDSNLHNLLKPIWQNIHSRIREKQSKDGLITYDDMLILANRLTQNRSLLSELQDKYRRFLIDEFQDTDPVQVKIVETLTGLKLLGSTVSEQSGEKTEQREGRLFAVGDPWQSIYKFRGAEVKVFSKITENLGSQGEIRTLTVNFRSHPSILNFINSFFDYLAQKNSYRFTIPFMPFESDTHTANNSQYRVVLAQPEGAPINTPTKTNPYRFLEARLIAKTISHIVEEKGWQVRDKNRNQALRGAKYEDITILFRATTQLRIYQNELIRLGIPFQVEGGKKVMNSQLLKDLLFVIKAIEEPWNTLALVGALRSLFFRIPDCAIYSYLHNYNDTDQSLAEALDILARYRKELPQMTAYQFLQELFSFAHLYHLFINAPRQRPLEVHLTERLLHMACVLTAEGKGDLRTFRKHLERLQEKEDDPDDPPAGTGGDVVRLCTIHSAKGLEFPIVILADLVYSPRGVGSPVILTDPIDGEIALNLKGDDNLWVTRNYEDLKNKINDEYKEEMWRILYVALTRARDYLVIPLVTLDYKPYRRDLSPYYVMFKNYFNTNKNGYQQLTINLEKTSSKMGGAENDSISPLLDELEEKLEKLEQEKDKWSEVIGRWHYKTIFPSRLGEEELDDRGGEKEHSPAAREENRKLGQAVHRYIAESLKDFGVDEERVQTIAYQEKVSENKVRTLLESLLSNADFMRMFQDAEERWSEVPVCEQEGQTFTYGRVDLLLKYPQNQIVLIDFKTGVRKEKDEHQMREYLKIFKKRLPEYTTRGCLVYLSPGNTALLVDIEI